MGCWEFNSGPLEGQSMFFTTEPFIQPRIFSPFLGCVCGVDFSVFLYTPGCLRAHFIDQGGLEPRDLTCICLLSAVIKGVHNHPRLGTTCWKERIDCHKLSFLTFICLLWYLWAHVYTHH